MGMNVGSGGGGGGGGSGSGSSGSGGSGGSGGGDGGGVYSKVWLGIVISHVMLCREGEG